MQPNERGINARLRAERLQRHWSQQELADRLGTTVTSIKRWERRATIPSAYFRLKLVALFGKSVQELGLLEEGLGEERTSNEDTAPLLENGAPSRDPSLSSREETNLIIPTPRQENLLSDQPEIHDANRERMLQLITTIWIDGMLKQSQNGANLLTPELYEQPGMVANPWRFSLQEMERSAQSFPPGTTITQAYDRANGHLLILGEPGSGKTTLLLELACTLLERARLDPTHPIPVPFNLSSWTVKRQSLQRWLVEELQKKYQVPFALSKKWVTSESILPLLDGLDEVAEPHRLTCIETINRYRNEHVLSPLVLCSRYAEYVALQSHLMMRSAVVLQPLTPQQIQHYLAHVGEQFDGLRIALQEEKELQTLATTPLMLSILMLTYKGVPRQKIFTPGMQENDRFQIFERYVERIFRHRDAPRHAPLPQTMRWLAWLARQLTDHQENEFHIEHLQFDWLPDPQRRWLLPGLSFGCIHGVLIGLIFAIFNGLFHSVRSGFILGGAVGIWNALLCSLLNSFLAWFTASKGSASRVAESSPQLEQLAAALNKRVIYGLFFAVANSLFIGVLFGVQNDLHLALEEALQYGLLYGLLIGCVFMIQGALPKIIQPTERVHWSWRNIRKNARRYLVIGVAIGLIFSIPYPVIVKMVLVAFTSFASLLVAGLSNDVLERHLRLYPNQGMWRSARNALQTGVVTGGLTWLVLSLLFGSFYGPTTGILYGFIPGVSLGLCLAMQRGGTACFLHLLLRWTLWRDDLLPFALPSFLDEAANRTLLRKVGGGYLFLHRSLQDYFVSVTIQKDSIDSEHARASQRMARRAILALVVGGASAVIGADFWPNPVGAIFCAYAKHLASVNSLTISPDSSLVASGSDDQTVRIWSAATGEDYLVLKESVPITMVAWCPRSNLLAIGGADGMVKVRDIERKTLVQTYRKQVDAGRIKSGCWSPDGSLFASVSMNGALHIWDIAGGETIAVLQCAPHMGTGVCTWSLDGRFLAFVESRRSIQVWSVSAKSRLATFTVEDDIADMAWSPDRKTFVLYTNGAIRFWNISQKQTTPASIDQVQQISCLCWSPDSTYLVTGGSDIQLWNARTRESLVTYYDESAIRAVAWAPDGRFFASTGVDTIVRLWQAP